MKITCAFIILTLTLSMSVHAKSSCGTTGSLDQRIKDCQKVQETSNKQYQLVTRTNDLKEVHLELSTGLLWSDALPRGLTYYQAEHICQSNLSSFTGITGQKWRLPTKAEYINGEKNKIRSVLPNMANDWFWTSTPYEKTTSFVWVYDSYNGKFEDYFRHDKISARCVSNQ